MIQKDPKYIHIHASQMRSVVFTNRYSTKASFGLSIGFNFFGFRFLISQLFLTSFGCYTHGPWSTRNKHVSLSISFHFLFFSCQEEKHFIFLFIDKRVLYHSLREVDLLEERILAVKFWKFHLHCYLVTEVVRPMILLHVCVCC